MNVQQFFVNYWREILSVVCLIVSTVLWIVRKKPVKVVDTLKELIVRLLPALINGAEATHLSGSEKLKMVLDSLSKILIDFGYGDDVVNQYLPFAKEQVEVILSTPQKKGVNL